MKLDLRGLRGQIKPIALWLPVITTLICRRIANSGKMASLSQCHAATEKGHNNSIPPIINLDNSWRPSTVVRRIAHVIIYPIKFVALRAATHIKNEHLKLRPCLAYLYAAASVMLPCLIVRIFAALPHVRPSAIFARMLSYARPSALAVRSIGRLGTVTMKAAATLGIATNKGSAANYKNCPAIALALPLRTTIGINPESANDRQSGKAAVGEIKSDWHLNILSGEMQWC